MYLKWLLRKVYLTKEYQGRSFSYWSHWSVINSTRCPVFIHTSWYVVCPISGFYTKLLINIYALISLLKSGSCGASDRFVLKYVCVSNMRVMERELRQWRSSVFGSVSLWQSELHPQYPKPHYTGLPLGTYHHKLGHADHLFHTAL